MTRPLALHNVAVSSIDHEHGAAAATTFVAMSLGGSGWSEAEQVEPHDTRWKAASDVFVVTAPAARIVDAAAEAMARLPLTSDERGLGFVIHTRRTEAADGPALIVSDVAEWDGGERRTAVVVSLVVDADDTANDGRRVRVRTHLEDGHTMLTGSRFAFEAHHDAMRASLVAAIRRVDRAALHIQAPSPPPVDRPAAAVRVEPRRVPRGRPPAGAVAIQSPGLDGRAFGGLALMGLGVVTMLVAVSTGTFQLAVGGIALGVSLGWAGSRLDGD